MKGKLFGAFVIVATMYVGCSKEPQTNAVPSTMPTNNSPVTTNNPTAQKLPSVPDNGTNKTETYRELDPQNDGFTIWFKFEGGVKVDSSGSISGTNIEFFATSIEPSIKGSQISLFKTPRMTDGRKIDTKEYGTIEFYADWNGFREIRMSGNSVTEIRAALRAAATRQPTATNQVGPEQKP